MNDMTYAGDENKKLSAILDTYRLSTEGAKQETGFKASGIATNIYWHSTPSKGVGGAEGLCPARGLYSHVVFEVRADADAWRLVRGIAEQGYDCWWGRVRPGCHANPHRNPDVLVVVGTRVPIKTPPPCFSWKKEKAVLPGSVGDYRVMVLEWIRYN